MALDPMPYSVRAFTGDVGDAQGLTKALSALRDAEQDAGRRAALDAVLSGRTTLREFLRTAQGREAVSRGSRALGERWDALSAEEREEQAERGRERESEWRAEVEALPEAARRRILPDC